MGRLWGRSALCRIAGFNVYGIIVAYCVTRPPLAFSEAEHSLFVSQPLQQRKARDKKPVGRWREPSTVALGSASYTAPSVDLKVHSFIGGSGDRDNDPLKDTLVNALIPCP